MAALPRELENEQPLALRLVERELTPCPSCTKPFWPFSPNGAPRRTCSHRCGQVLRRAEEGVDLVDCPSCGNPFERRRSGRPRMTCSRRCKNIRYKAMLAELAEPPQARPVVGLIDTSRVREIILAMPNEDRTDYEVEGCLPLVPLAAGLVFEDLDDTPVSTACPECWRQGGYCCTSCPSPISRKAINAELRQRRQSTLARATR